MVGPDVPAPAADPSSGLAWAEVRAALDDALAALPARLRDPLVLCYLEGLTRDEAAAVLRCSPASVKGRVARGRERLRRLLDGRGLSLSLALAGSLVAAPVVAPDAAAATARTAAAFRATGAAPPAVRALLRGSLFGGKLVTGLVGLVLAGAVAALLLGRAGPAAEPPPADAAPANPRAPAAAAVDALGDALPAGAVARLGTRRLCGPIDAQWVAFSPDGSKVAARNWNAVSVWDTSTGRPLVERENYRPVGGAIGWRADGKGVAILAGPDGSYFASTFTDPEEKLPPLGAAAPRAGPAQGPDGLDYVALSPDATRLAVVRPAGEKEFAIDLLPVTPGQPVDGRKPQRTLGPFPGAFREVRYTADGQLAVLHGPWEAKGDWSVAVINTDKNKVTRIAHIPAPGYCVWQYMLSLSADARLAAVAPRAKLATNTHEGTIRVWDLAAGKELWNLPFPEGGYGTGHAFTPDGKRLITSTKECYFQVWDVATGKEAARSPVTGGAVYGQDAAAVAVSPDGKRLATARRDGRVDVWDTATGKPAVPLATHRDIIEAVAVSPDSRVAATLGYDGTVRLWELATGKPRFVIPASLGGEPRSRFWASARPAFTPDGRRLLFTAGGELAMADPATGKLLDLPAGMRGRRGNVGGFTADGKTLATFAKDAVTLWDWPAGTARVTATVPLGPVAVADPKAGREIVTVHSAALSPDGQFLFTGSTRWNADPARGGYPNTNDVWDARTGKRLHRPITKSWHPPAAFSPDSRVLYLGGSSLTAWDVAAMRVVQQLTMPGPGSVRPIAVSPDGRLLAVAIYEETPEWGVWLYETASGRIIKKFTGHSRWVADLAFSPDCRRLVSVGEDQTGLVWDVTLPALGGAEGGKPAEAWDRLAAEDPGPAYTIMVALAAAPAEAVPLLRGKLGALPVPSAELLDRLVGRLDEEEFADRERASAELDRLGPSAVNRVRSRLVRATAPEVCARLTRFLEKHDGPNSYQLRCVRGVAILEAAGTAEARALLAELAKGPADSLLTGEAQAAIRRGRGR